MQKEQRHVIEERMEITYKSLDKCARRMLACVGIPFDEECIYAPDSAKCEIREGVIYYWFQALGNNFILFEVDEHFDVPLYFEELDLYVSYFRSYKHDEQDDMLEFTDEESELLLRV